MNPLRGAVTTGLTTAQAVEAVAWGRAPWSRRPINRRVVCQDGFAASVQASHMHYAHDSHPGGEAPYWRGIDPEIVYPFTTFEVGRPTSDPEPADVWSEWDSGGVWAWVPRQAVADLLDLHGGAVGWEPTS